MRVLFVAGDTIPHVGGKSSHVIDLAKGMRALGVSTDIISLRSLGRLSELSIKARLAFYRLNDRNVFYYRFQSIWRDRLNQLVREACELRGYEFISVQDAFAGSAIARAVDETGITAVLTMHTYFGLENGLDRRDQGSQQIYEAQLSRELEALSVVQGVIAVDDRIRCHVEKATRRVDQSALKVKRITSIPNFTDVSLYSPPTLSERIEARHALGLSNEQFAVCCVRRLVEKNGVLKAVEAMLELGGTSIVLLIAGDGPQKPEIVEFVREKGLSDRVRLLGALDRERVLQLYRASDVSVVPSITVNGLQEATSISAIEAMACGLPTVASNIGGLSQLIESGETGVLCEEGESRDIADAFVRLRLDEDFRRRIGSAGRRQVELHHSHLAAAREYLNEFVNCSQGGQT